MKQLQWSDQSSLGGPLCILWFLICLTGSASAASLISRRIQNENGAIRITDNLRCNGNIAQRDVRVWDVYVERKANGTNLQKYIQSLLGTSLTLINYQSRFDKGTLDLEVLSQVNMAKGASNAKVQWVSSFVGLNLILDGRKLSDSAFLTIWLDGKRAVAYFPSLGIIDGSDPYLDRTEALTALDNLDLRLACSLSSESEGRLFNWDSALKSRGKVNVELIRRMHTEHRLTHNELFSLFTNLHIAKAGYYELPPTKGK